MEARKAMLSVQWLSRGSARAASTTVAQASWGARGASLGGVGAPIEYVHSLTCEGKA